MEPGAIAAVAAFVLFGGIAAHGARGSYRRYETIASLLEETGTNAGHGSETTVRGAVTVTEPATPERPPPGSVDGADAPALWAWRVRSKEYTGETGSSYDWRTGDGGLAVGEFEVRDDWAHVAVDPASVGAAARDDAADVVDPFDAPELFLGTPEIEEFLGDLDPINRRLHEWGLADEEGVLANVEVSIGVGNWTTMPDRYQATVVAEGEAVVVRGDQVETDDGPVLRGTEEVPLVLAAADTLEAQAERLRSTARRRVAYAAVLVLLGVAALVATVV